MGEAPKLDQDESLAVATRIIQRMNVPVVVGVSAPGFAAMRTLTRSVMEKGAAGVMIAPPNTLRTDDQIVTYYRQASEAIGSDVPFVLQDYPLTFSVVMTPAVVRRIVSDQRLLRDAEARRLAGPRENLDSARFREKMDPCGTSPFSAAMADSSSTSSASAAPMGP